MTIRIFTTQLIKLGDMIGDGLHLEPDGKWISREYRQVAKALGYPVSPSRKSNIAGINKAMEEALKTAKCQCGGKLKQNPFWFISSKMYRSKLYEQVSI